MDYENMTTVERAFYQCHDAIYAQALKIVKNVHDAEDIRSDVYKKIQHLKSAQFVEEREVTFTTWIYRITNHVILDFLRTNHQDKYKAVSDFADGDDESKSYFDFVASERFDADSEVLTKELKAKIRKAFSTLKPKYRAIAKLYFLNDLPYAEIAEIVEVPIGTVKGMLSRARARLQDELDGVHNFKASNVQRQEA